MIGGFVRCTMMFWIFLCHITVTMGWLSTAEIEIYCNANVICNSCRRCRGDGGGNNSANSGSSGSTGNRTRKVAATKNNFSCG